MEYRRLLLSSRAFTYTRRCPQLPFSPPLMSDVSSLRELEAWFRDRLDSNESDRISPSLVKYAKARHGNFTGPCSTPCLRAFLASILAFLLVVCGNISQGDNGDPT